MRRIRQRNLANIDFADFQRTVEYYEFKLIRIRGSHHIYLNAVHGLQTQPPTKVRSSEPLPGYAVPETRGET